MSARSFFFEELDEATLDIVDKSLQWVSSAYTVGGAAIQLSRPSCSQRHNFGELEQDRCVRDRLAPVKFESFSKTLGKFLIRLLGFGGLLYDVSVATGCKHERASSSWHFTIMYNVSFHRYIHRGYLEH